MLVIHAAKGSLRHIITKFTKLGGKGHKSNEKWVKSIKRLLTEDIKLAFHILGDAQLASVQRLAPLKNTGAFDGLS